MSLIQHFYLQLEGISVLLNVKVGSNRVQKYRGTVLRYFLVPLPVPRYFFQKYSVFPVVVITYRLKVNSL